ncbi:MAG: hypothetical protein ACKO7Z_04415 [Cyanobacteriota bacterium]
MKPMLRPLAHLLSSPRLSLSGRLTLLLLAVGLTPMIVSQLLSVRVYERRIFSNEIDYLETITTRKVEQLEGLLTTKSIELDDLTEAPQLRRDWRALGDGTDRSADPAALRRTFQMLAARNGFADLLVLDADAGRLLFASRPMVAGPVAPGEVIPAGSRLAGLLRQFSPASSVVVTPLDRDPSLRRTVAYIGTRLPARGAGRLVLVGVLRGLPSSG